LRGGVFPSPPIPLLDLQLFLPLPAASFDPFVLASPDVLVALVPLLVIVVVLSFVLLTDCYVYLYLAPGKGSRQSEPQLHNPHRGVSVDLLKLERKQR
jgi:hypothetical protein